MRFLHAADIHLDSPLLGLAGRAGARADELVGATRRALVRLVDAALAEPVAFLIIAGDLYDGDWRDFMTGLFFAGQMARLERANIPVIILRGNHDAESLMTKQLSLPGNVRVFSARKAETIRLDDLRVALHGRSFPSRHVTENIALSYPPPVAGYLNIGVLHTALEGRPPHAPYAPCSIADLMGKGYDYWALGHVHERAVLAQDPWIIFPGNLQGRHANETGPKGATLVSVEEGRIAKVEALALDQVRWAKLVVDASDCADEAALGDRLAAALTAASTEAEGRTLAVRLCLVGRTGLHRWLKSDTERLAAEVELAASRAGGDIWIERIVIETTDAVAVPAAAGDALAELAAAIAELRDDPAARGLLADDLAALRHRLPPGALEAAGLAGEDEAAMLEAVLADAESLLLNRLAGEA
ncbi:DNA repair exonuclease [Niveispirillum sp. SYP-B3756]|uniref:metallophosphoesterase family protein n=1 Tax=Niveispirillum sp. SYP-B3756 TaxID=2662178 RepID=UPI00129237B7|nr:DNA repair exonuclease [Niveispirillum sp. SYP-B3756]MQP64890.1 DNA repair exonuclease [Niveispirillum sp. SYP-B3756]